LAGVLARINQMKNASTILFEKLQKKYIYFGALELREGIILE
jgi:hypothetical protein